MAQGQSTKTISMIKWTRTSGLSKKNSLSRGGAGGALVEAEGAATLELRVLLSVRVQVRRSPYAPANQDLGFIDGSFA